MHDTHQLREDVAVRYGVGEALFLNHVYWWLRKNAANGKHLHAGRTWTYNSARAFTALFPFWTTRQIQRIIESCVKQGALVTGNYNTAKFDRTSWYSLTDAALVLFTENVKPISPNGETHFPKTGNASNQNVEPIPVVKPVVKPESSFGENQGELNLVPAPPVINKHRKIMDLYNAAAEEAGLPRCTVLNASRKRQIDARLAEYPSPKQWTPVFQTVRNFKRRVDDGDRMGWFSFDWIIKSSVNFDKVAADWLAGIPTDKQRGVREQKKNRPSNAHYEGTDSLVHRTIAARTIRVNLSKPETV